MHRTVQTPVRVSLTIYDKHCALVLLPSGLVRHVCNLFTETVTLCLDADNRNSNETAAALLCSLLDILHGMLTYTSSVVRLALQVDGLFSRTFRSPALCHTLLPCSPF